MTQTPVTKADLRKAAFKARKAAHDAEAHDAGARAAAAVQSAGMLREATVVAGYCPIRTEIDPTPLMAALHANGCRLCVPVIQGAGLPLIFAEWWPGCRLIVGPFGAAVPDGTPLLVPDALVVPLVAFDRAGWRLGYGGGFYDRTLERLRARRGALALGYAYDAQEMDRVPTEPTDQPLDWIVTEKGAERFAAGGCR